MLKRQRPISPPPSTPDVPLVASTSASAHWRPAETKRRRTAPPVLDGQLRGWGAMEEEYAEESETEEEDMREHGGRGGEDAQLIGNAGYKVANTLLNELHVLNHHLHILSSSQSASYPNASRSNAPSHPSHRPSVDHSSYTLYPKETPPPSVPREASPTYCEEKTRVTERYEDTNRLLKTLFLSRRRELGENRQPSPN